MLLLFSVCVANLQPRDFTPFADLAVIEHFDDLVTDIGILKAASFVRGVIDINEMLHTEQSQLRG